MACAVAAAAGNVATMDVVPRHAWTDVAPISTEMEYRKAAARYVFYTHTADTAKCHVTSECCAQVLNIQYLHMNVRRAYWLLVLLLNHAIKLLTYITPLITHLLCILT